MKYLSVCSGIEAATVAWHPLGWKPWAFSEIEKFPSAFLAHHYPDVPNLGDMTKFKEWPDANIDVLVGGTPCQSFSVAGLRKGLDDPRGNLMLTYLAIAGRYRPIWMVWENVPGVLSSNGGKDFGTFLGGLAELGYGFAYRILDAQYAGVPQRRRRVFVVGYLGDWRRAAAVLFERHSLQGHPPPSRKTRETTTHDVAPSLTGSGRGVERCGDSRGQDPVVAVANGITARVENSSSTAVLQPVAFQSKASTTQSMNPSGITPTLDVGKVDGVAVAFAENSRAELRLCGGDGNVSSQLATGGGKPGQGQPCIAFDMRGREGGAMPEGPHNTANIRAASGGSSRSYIANQMQVRRLTPVECERLQGFPDNYTRIPWRNKTPENCPDGPRYKAIGNSMAVPVMRWIGERIQKVNEMQEREELSALVAAGGFLKTLNDHNQLRHSED